MLDTSKFSLIQVKIEFDENHENQVWTAEWIQGEFDHIAVSDELWENAYDFFIPPGQILALGNRIKIGPFETEFMGCSQDKILQFKLVFPQQKGKYKIGMKEDKWTKIS